MRRNDALRRAPRRRYGAERPLGGWSGKWSLTSRILAVNIFVLAMLAGSFFYLDSYRTRISEERTDQAQSDMQMIAAALVAVPPAARPALAAELAGVDGERLRIYDPASGERLSDSWAGRKPTYNLRDPQSEPWQKHVARFMDRVFDHVVGADPLGSYGEPAHDGLAAWPEATASAPAPPSIAATRFSRASVVGFMMRV